MKKLIPLILVLVFASCKKETPQIKCGFITAKNGGSFYIGDEDAIIKVSDSVYNSHKVGDYYCYQ